MATLPMVLADEEKMVATVVHWIDLVGRIMTSEAGRLMMRNDIHERLRAGTIPTMEVIWAAEAGHQDADLALRQLIAEKIDRREALPVALANYAQRALIRPFANYPQGETNVVDTWTRNVGVAVMVDMARVTWGLPVARNPASGLPSAAGVVAKGLKIKGFRHLGRSQVARIHREHGELAARLCASVARFSCIRQD
jgi:hypothetical protein